MLTVLVQESGKLSGLPPPPEEVGGKRKRRGGQDDMPSSLRHMLELKVRADTLVITLASAKLPAVLRFSSAGQAMLATMFLLWQDRTSTVPCCRSIGIYSRTLTHP